MRQVRVVLICDEGFVADSLRDFASACPEPSLEEMFDIEVGNIQSERERKLRELQKMNTEELKWIEETIEKLKFLRSRGFEERNSRTKRSDSGFDNLIRLWYDNCK